MNTKIIDNDLSKTLPWQQVHKKKCVDMQYLKKIDNTTQN